MSGGLTAVEVPGVPTLVSNQVSVGNTVTLIVAARTGRRGVIIINHGTVDVFLGNGSVLVTTGLLLAGTKGNSISIPGSMDIYGITATSQTVSYLEIY